MRNTEKNAFKYVDDRLENWASWSERENGQGIGYYPCNLVELIRLRGGVVANMPFGHRPLKEDKLAEEMEQLIRRLHMHAPRQVAVLKQAYLRIGTPQQKSKRVGLTPDQFKHELVSAKQWLSKQLKKPAY